MSTALLRQLETRLENIARQREETRHSMQEHSRESTKLRQSLIELDAAEQTIKDIIASVSQYKD